MQKIDLKIPLNNIENILGSVTSPSIVISELLKNSIDSNANTISINILTKKNKEIIVDDDGDGFTFDDLTELAKISESTKKNGVHIYRKDGSFLSGSKGLGILSIFSISDKFIMETENNNNRYRVIWCKGECSFTYEKINSKNINGTKISIVNISEEYLSILTDENEINKLKHISIKNYIKSSLRSKNILFFINNIPCNQLNISNINDLRTNFKANVKFEYNSKNNTLSYCYLSNNNKINNNTIKIPLLNTINITNLLVNNYYLSKVTYKGEPFRYLQFPLENFYGEIFVTENKKNTDLSDFGEGVRIFVNQFAMYGYLDKENDWLNFSVFSMQRKNTRFKPHNVFGYVHFENLNENESCLKISNERAYFVENGAFRKFIEIMKNLITTLSFNIDVADKNNFFIENICNQHDSNSNLEFSSKTNAAEQLNLLNFNSDNRNSTTISNPTDNNSSNNNNTNINNSTDNSDNDNKTDINTSTDNNSDNDNNTNISNSSDNSDNGNKTDINNSTSIKLNPKPKFNFFTTSNIIKSSNKIKIDYNELINQLRKLNYKDCYLLYVITFRSMLEDISKKYLNSRKINLQGDFGKNIRLMTDDILQIINNKSLIDTTDKIYIENIFGGYNAFKNFFQVTGDDFYCISTGKQGIKATRLNSFVHAPRWMEIEEAENIANNIILPLYVVSKEIIKKIKH